MNLISLSAILYFLFHSIVSLSSQTYSLDMIDSSYSVIKDNGVTQENVAMFGYNKQRDRGELVLLGSNPQLSLNNLQIGHLGGNELGLDGDIVPYSSVSFDLGNNVSDEHWDQVVATTFVTYMPPLTAKIKVIEMQPVMSMIDQLHPYNFWSKNGTGRLGFSIAELERLFPEVVISSDVDYDATNETLVKKNTSKGINYDAFIPILIQAMQDQQDEIDSLNKRIRALEK